MLVCLALQKCCCFLEQTFFFFAGYLLDYALASHMSYPSTAYFPGGACCGISVLGADSQGFFLLGCMDGGLVLGSTVINVSRSFSDSFRLCAVLTEAGKFQDVVSP